jgi:hypothetical protein
MSRKILDINIRQDTNYDASIFDGFSKMKIIYFDIPLSLYNLDFSIDLNGTIIPFQGFISVTSLLAYITPLINAVLPAMTITYDGNTHMITFANALAFNLTFSETAGEFFGFTTLVNAGVLSITSDKIMNFLPQDYIFMKFNGLFIDKSNYYYDGVHNVQDYDYLFSISNTRLLDYIDFSTKLRVEPNFKEHDKYKIKSRQFNVELFDKFGNAINLMGQTFKLQFVLMN